MMACVLYEIHQTLLMQHNHINGKRLVYKNTDFLSGLLLTDFHTKCAVSPLNMDCASICIFYCINMLCV